MRFAPPPKDSFHEETLFSCFVGKRVRDASIYVSKNIAQVSIQEPLPPLPPMLQCYMLHVTCYIKKNQLWAFSVSKNSIYK